MIPRRLLLPLAASLLALGCSSEPYDTARVSGRLTLNGKPIPMAAVMFQPIAPEGNINPGPGSYGITDADGRYSLKVVGKETTGAVVGKHKVRITNHTEPDDPSNDGPRKRTKREISVPGRYNQQDALLEYTVPSSGSSDANFDLTVK